MAQMVPTSPLALPFLADNSPKSCPVSMPELARYVRAHGEGARDLQPAQLTFVRTAQIEECRYWMWRYRAEGSRWYALVMEDAAGSWMCCHRAQDRLAPENVLLDDYRLAMQDA